MISKHWTGIFFLGSRGSRLNYNVGRPGTAGMAPGKITLINIAWGEGGRLNLRIRQTVPNFFPMLVRQGRVISNAEFDKIFSTLKKKKWLDIYFPGTGRSYTFTNSEKIRLTNTTVWFSILCING